LEKLLKMFVYLIILLIYLNFIVSELLNNSSLVVFEKYNYGSLNSAKFEKTINQMSESDSDLLVETHYFVRDIDYSLSANLIIWTQCEHNDKTGFCWIFAIPINKR
jgi:hypothetical protein